jgi:hypothetical protein
MKSQENGESCTLRGFIFYSPPQILLGRSWERRGICTEFCWESQKEREHLENQGVDERMGSEWILVS